MPPDATLAAACKAVSFANWQTGVRSFSRIGRFRLSTGPSDPCHSLRTRGARCEVESDAAIDHPADPAAEAACTSSGRPTRAGRASSGTYSRRGRRSGCAARSRRSTPWPGAAPSGCWDAAARRGLRPRARRADRQPGGAEVRAGLKAIYLSGWQVAADANLAGHTYPDQSLYPANSRAGRGAADQQRAAARRPDHHRRGRRRRASTGWPRSWPTPRPASAACSTPTS